MSISTLKRRLYDYVQQDLGDVDVRLLVGVYAKNAWNLEEPDLEHTMTVYDRIRKARGVKILHEQKNITTDLTAKTKAVLLQRNVAQLSDA